MYGANVTLYSMPFFKSHFDNMALTIKIHQTACSNEGLCHNSWPWGWKSKEREPKEQWLI